MLSLPFKFKQTDLHLDDDDTGTKFVTLVVVMMTALATIAIGGALIVGALRGTWVDAVKGNLTIELPASDGHGIVRSGESLAQSAQTMQAAISKLPGVASVHVLSADDVKKLVQPWLGADVGTDDLPLPALLGVTLKDADDVAASNSITKTVQSMDAAALTETHQSWLTDLRRFSLVLLLAALAMAAATIACCIVTVAGAITARLSEHSGDIDLLHVMGATDNYIGRQFVETVVRNVGGATLAGTLIGFCLLKMGGLVAGELQSTAMSNVGWHFTDYLCFIALPVLVTGLCFVAARITVLRSLRVMP